MRNSEACESCDKNFSKILFALAANKNQELILNDYETKVMLNKSSKAMKNCKCRVVKVYCDSCCKLIKNQVRQ